MSHRASPPERPQTAREALAKGTGLLGGLLTGCEDESNKTSAEMSKRRQN